MPASPPSRPRRLVFLGTPEVAVASLRALVEAGFDVPLVVSQPDRRRGRGSEVSPTPVKAAALALGLAVTDRVDDVIELDADLGVVVAYGEILRAPVLDALPMVNVHFSLLPRWRGAAPVERALLAGDDRTGVCVMEVVAGLDAGGVHASAEVPIGPRTTAGELRARLASVGADLLVRTLRDGLGAAVAQQGEVTYAHKLGPDDLRLDWTRSAPELDRVVRVGGAWTTFRDQRLRVWGATPAEGDPAAVEPGLVAVADGIVIAATGAGALVLDEVQPEGRARLSASDWARGARLTGTDRLGA
ncbi:methionyl-tRNA formyltransferase [Iamia sp.]|uniref:methionyl-tRNA formyltransferase n=1 Tax=Iamia sp. TaxID=2722710 RepID=UPI002B81D71A|nr:methionyl-tRNA formyltransferase [Iamia sp.]HXH57854.1 methionyl-tRNA formyltransferase [Iamia sp.]